MERTTRRTLMLPNTLMLLVGLVGCGGPEPGAGVEPDAGVMSGDASAPPADASSDASETDVAGLIPREFPGAQDSVKHLVYSRSEGIVSCVQPGEFQGEIDVQGNALDALVVTLEGDERIQSRMERELTSDELGELRDLVLAVPPRNIQMEHNCDPCSVSQLQVDDHGVFRECCGVCNPEFEPAFDRVAAFLESLVPR